MLVTKDQFYEATKRRDEELSRASTRWLSWLVAAVFVPLLAGLFLVPLNKEPAPERAWFMAGYLFIVLCIYMPVTRRLQDAINQRHGMKCTGCKNTFEHLELVHLGFKGACSKCGQAPFCLPKERE